MIEAPRIAEGPVEGPIPRYAIASWESAYGVVAGVTGRGSAAAPFDLALGRATTDLAWGRLAGAFPGFRGVVVGRQVHGSRVDWHEGGSGLMIRADVDGHATRAAGLLLVVTLADCVPIYLVDPVARAIGLLHAGWRGVAAGVLERGIATLSERAGSRTDDIVVHCGVSICGACYEVGPEVFSACGLPTPETRSLLDLRAVIKRRALDLGLRDVTISSRCSAHESDTFFSHRRSGGTDGRMVAYLGLSGEPAAKGAPVPVIDAG